MSRLPSEVPSVDTLLREAESLEKHLSHISSRTVLCHNDLLTKNIIYNQAEGSVRFIDYEYANYNYQAYDIGNHFNEFAGVDDVDYSLYPSQELQRDWLRVYLENYKQCLGLQPTVSAQEVHSLYVKVCKFSLVSHFSWGLWALLQARYSTIDFDFLRSRNPRCVKKKTDRQTDRQKRKKATVRLGKIQLLLQEEGRVLCYETNMSYLEITCHGVMTLSYIQSKMFNK
ncbi:hypothetical protein AAFF_G00015300 [Aldrovandia affinis]|uniref:ethanolamine kinase n=1 Tax=Aldrovandia affinis TaxID=143900 RepID=A0AAD7S624_9TELE|nr:hypothetical protein AAFF_G00015300 [Aldrovandia affinis]